MALWMVRAGKTGEYENKYLQDQKIYLTWDGFDYDLDKIKNWEELLEQLNIYFAEKPKTIQNWASQVWAFAKEIKQGDWVVLPSKFQATLHFGVVTSHYQFHATNEDPYFHSLDIDWFAIDVPRTLFDQDILYSLGAFLTVCRIRRDNAETRVKAIVENYLTGNGNIPLSNSNSDATEANEKIESEALINEEPVELEELSYDQIAKFIEENFKGHDMERIIEGILKAKGFTVYHSPKGPDGGVDLLVGAEPYGFGSPRICVQVKATKSPVEREVLDRLIGVMDIHKAELGILASWGGFKRSINEAMHFFKVRLWGRDDIIRELLENYHKLDENLRSELPFKRIWILATNTSS